MWRMNDDGVIEMPEGLEVSAESVGLRIKVVDYHARDVVIPWSMIHRLEETKPEPEPATELAGVVALGPDPLDP